MTLFHKYPEIAGLEKRPEILAVKEVVATEKLHGTNFRVFFPEGMASVEEVQFGGRNDVFTPEQGQDFYGGRPMGGVGGGRGVVGGGGGVFHGGGG